MGVPKDIKGKKYGRLLVLSIAGRDKFRKVTWNCLCDCGNSVVVAGCSLRSGTTSSCGCYQKIACVTHGGYKSKEYKSWAEMLSRCNNPNTTAYHNYGGRGIRVCERWANSFATFLADMGPKPSPSHSIDRINNEGDYFPGNCRWATKKEQDTNRRQTRLYTLYGKTMCLKDWAKYARITYDALRGRIDRQGMSLEVAINTSLGRKGRKRTSLRNSAYLLKEEE